MNHYTARNMSIVPKLALFIVVIASFLVCSFVFIYFKQLKNVDAYNSASVSAVENLFKLSVIDYLVTGDVESLESLIENSIKEGLIFGIVVYSDGNDIALQYPANMNFNTNYVDVQLPHLNLKTSQDSHFKIFLNQSQIEIAKNQFTVYAILFFCFVLFSIALSVVVLKKHFVKPIQDLSEQAGKIAKGHYNFKPSTCFSKEIEILSQSLAEISAALKERSEKQELHMNEIVKANGELVLDRSERAKYLENLINTATSCLTESLICLQSIANRPIQHSMLNKSLLFVLTQFEQARMMLNESHSPLKFEFEKMTLGEYSRLVSEYANFFSKTKSTLIEFSLRYDPTLHVDKVFVLVDKKVLIKILSLILEIMGWQGGVAKTQKTTVLLVIDNVKDGVVIIDVIVRVDSGSLNVHDCARINAYFQSNIESEDELESTSENTSLNTLAIKSLKYITTAIKAEYQVHSISSRIESRYICSMLTCEKDETIVEKLRSVHSTLKESAITVVGSRSVIANINNFQYDINVIDYDFFTANTLINQDTHYVIDCISNHTHGRQAAQHLRNLGLKTKNVALLIEGENVKDDFVEYSYEVGADLIITDSINHENITMITGIKQRSKTDHDISQLIESLTSVGEQLKK